MTGIFHKALTGPRNRPWLTCLSINYESKL